MSVYHNNTQIHQWDVDIHGPVRMAGRIGRYTLRMEDRGNIHMVFVQVDVGLLLGYKIHKIYTYGICTDSGVVYYGIIYYRGGLYYGVIWGWDLL